jgi:lipopolysaccharide transport system ATP-binding protein
MSDIAIKVENLGKSYLVGHNAAQSEQYTALRDVIARSARNFVRKTRDMFTGRPIVQGDEVEEFWALKNINFKIKQGERVGIIGRNGAGKSTLLKILSRITEPTTGRVTIDGRVASLLEVGTGFHPELTGRENIYLNGAILGMSRAEVQRKFDEIVSFSEIEKFLDTPVKRFSSGMYVRLAFAVAAHLEPDILVVDEVLAVGDSQFQKKCISKMEQQQKNGRTVLFVSHNLGVVNSLCDKCIWLESGLIAMHGESVDVVEKYLYGVAESNGQFLSEIEEHKACSITRISIFDLHARNIVASVPFQAGFRVAIDVWANEDMDAVIGIGISNVAGDIITTIHTIEIGEDEKSSPLLRMNAGTNAYELFVGSNVLRPGSYHISASVFSRKLHQNYDFKERKVIFSVSEHGESRYFDNRQQGMVFLADAFWRRT